MGIQNGKCHFYFSSRLSSVAIALGVECVETMWALNDALP